MGSIRDSMRVLLVMRCLSMFSSGLGVVGHDKRTRGLGRTGVGF